MEYAMWIAIRSRLIGAGFTSWTKFVRLKRRLSGQRPRLRMLDHITIPVCDLTRARRFYCDVLGASYLMTVDDETFRRYGRPPATNNGEQSHHLSVYLDGPTRLDLFLQQDGQPAATHGHPHYAFGVPPGDLLEWKKRLTSQGVPTDGPLQLGPPGQASLYFNDPFGNHLEITCMGFSHAVEQRPPQVAKLSWKTE
jgi:catechol 2,3-dioxygenase-like lactoylglutathione lyase family enzyme